MMTREEVVAKLDNLSRCLTYPELDDLQALNDQLCEQEQEIARLTAQLAGWAELEGRDIYQRYTDARAEIKRLREALNP